MTSQREPRVDTNKYKYVFQLKSSGDLTVAMRLIEVLKLKQGEYLFNGNKGSIEVIRDNKWEDFLSSKIKDLGFEDILQGKSYSTSIETTVASLSDSYSNLDSVNKLHNKIYQTYGKGNRISINTTEIDHIKSNVISKFTITSNNSKINKVDYAVALSIYNRCCYPINSAGAPVVNIDDIINMVPDQEMVKTLNILKNIFL